MNQPEAKSGAISSPKQSKTILIFEAPSVCKSLYLRIVISNPVAGTIINTKGDPSVAFFVTVSSQIKFSRLLAHQPEWSKYFGLMFYLDGYPLTLNCGRLIITSVSRTSHRGGRSQKSIIGEVK